MFRSLSGRRIVGNHGDVRMWARAVYVKESLGVDVVRTKRV
jgi:hypothetical protein